MGFIYLSMLTVEVLRLVDYLILFLLIFGLMKFFTFHWKTYLVIFFLINYKIRQINVTHQCINQIYIIHNLVTTNLIVYEKHLIVHDN